MGSFRTGLTRCTKRATRREKLLSRNGVGFEPL